MSNPGITVLEESDSSDLEISQANISKNQI